MIKILFIIVPLLFISFLASLPSLIVLIQAKRRNLKISFVQAYSIYKLPTSKKSFLNSVKGFNDNEINVSILDLSAHVWAGGNIENCLKGLIYAKENKLGIDYRTVTALDLSNKNILDSLGELNKENELKIESISNDKITIEYKAIYKYKFALVDKDGEKVKTKTEEKLKKFLESWNNENAIETEKMIRDNILNTDYFEGNLGVNVLKQEFMIRKKY